MGFDSKPKTTQVNPNTPAQMQAANSGSKFVNAILTNQQNPFGGITSPLQQQAVGNLSTFLNQQSPEMTAFNQLNDGLMGFINGGLGGGMMQNPFGDMGAMNQAQQLISAAQPRFQQNLQAGLGQLASSAPGRFSTAFQSQANDLTRNALSDFNLFQQNALMQGLGLQQQAQQSALNFMLGAGGLQQQGQQNALQASGLLGQLAGQAGMNPFNRAIGAGQMGLAMNEQQINPMLQLMLGSLGFAKPAPLDTVVSQGGGGFGGFLGGALGSFLGPVGTAAGSALGGKLFG